LQNTQKKKVSSICWGLDRWIFFLPLLSFQIFWTCGATTTKTLGGCERNGGPLSSSGHEEEAEAEEEGEEEEEEEGSEPAHHSATFRRMGQYVTTRMAV
jgi:hypothetical protein